MQITNRLSRWFRRFVFSSILLLLNLSAAQSAEFIVFNRTYIREKGSPVTLENTFSVWNPQTTWTLRAVNGSLEDDTIEKVSSSVSIINGVEVLRPNQFNQQVSLIEDTVVLSVNNVIATTVRGRPSGQLTISIIGEDALPPVISNIYPIDGMILAGNDPVLHASFDDDVSGVDVSRAQSIFDGSDITSAANVTPTGFEYIPSELLDDGEHEMTIRLWDKAGNAAQKTVTFITDTTPPVIADVLPQDGTVFADDFRPVLSAAFSDNASGIDVPSVEILLDDVPVTASADISQTGFTYAPAEDLPVGTHTFSIGLSDRAGNAAQEWHGTFILEEGSQLPPDPAEVAPPVNEYQDTPFLDAVSFLFTGDKPIQTGVEEDTIVARRVAVVRGKVMTRDNAPLSGVEIKVHGAPEFGQTLSREDGMFDLAVNGGGFLTVDYKKDGFLTAQRQIDVPWRDFVYAPDVVMIPLDENSTVVTLDGSQTEMQVARGSLIDDEDGERQATVMFPAGTIAQLVYPGGPGEYIDTLTVRATEYTVGDNGPQAMPAELPPTSGYTYAVELSADEAIAAGASSVSFDPPLIQYVENFIGFPVGGIVPVGYYSRIKGQWLPQDNGRVVKILGVGAGGLAELDINGSDVPADASALEGLGVTDAERLKLAELYVVGQSLWRVPMKHFSPFDCNWPFGPTPMPGAEAPQLPPLVFDKKINDPCGPTDRCTIDNQNQILRETIPIAGTPFALNYASDRVPGRKPELNIPLTRDTIPPGLKSVELEIEVAGQLIKQSFPAEANQQYTFTWDVNNVYNRPLQGSVKATTRVGYLYDGQYYDPREIGQSFAAISGVPSQLVNGRSGVALWQSDEGAINIGVPYIKNVGGWTLNVHHTYDADTGTLYYGEGHFVTTDHLHPIIKNVAGTGSFGYGGDEGSALLAKLRSPADVVVAPNGGIYIADTSNSRIRYVSPNGIISTVAGNGVHGYGGDGGLAIFASLWMPQSIALGPEGNLYIADTQNKCVRKVDTDGIITTFAGQCGGGGGLPGIMAVSGMELTEEASPIGDNGPADQATLIAPYAIEAGPDGSVYIADIGDCRVRKVDGNGIITTYAGNGEYQYAGDNGPAWQASFYNARDIELAPDGSLYIATGDCRIRHVGPDGIITTVAGNGTCYGPILSGIPATQAILRYPQGITVSQEGVIYVSDLNGVKQINPDGIILNIAGHGVASFADGAPANQVSFRPKGLDISPDGYLYGADPDGRRIAKIMRMFPDFGETYAVPSESGDEIYHFDVKGKHLLTANALTGAVVYAFNYNDQGQLTQIEDGDGNVTTIERNPNGDPISITGPFGQHTSLELGSDGYLNQVTNPAGEAVIMTYKEGGLLETFKKPEGAIFTYTYDPQGRFIRDDDPAGGFLELSRVATQPKSSEVTQTTAEGRVTSYLTEELLTGQTRRLASSQGDTTESVASQDGSVVVHYADGTTVTEIEGPDPRFAMQSPLIKQRVHAMPSGLSMTTTEARSVVLSDPLNVFSLVSQTDTTTINGRAFTSFYDAATKQMTITSPEGRQTFLTMDNQGRTMRSQTAGLAPVFFTYDDQGRLTTTVEGEGADARTTQLEYNARSYLDTSTDALSQQTRFTYDAVGRVERQIQPNLNEIAFDYDLNGNMISLVPPEKPAHTFTYTDVDLEEDYIPPDLGLGVLSTHYDYNLDRDVTVTTRPDGRTIGFSYDAKGRLDVLTTPTHSIDYSYMSGDRVQSINTSDGEALSYTYNGSLSLSETWAGTVSGSVAQVYDNNFRITSQNVNGASAISFVYDRDGLLKQSGALTLTRHAQHGLVTATALGSLADSRSFNLFGELSAYQAQWAGSPLLSDVYTRDKLGRIIEKSETVGGVTTAFVYTYDEIGQLTEVRKDGTLVAEYDYDANGNRLSLTTPSGTLSGLYDQQDRLTAYGDNEYNYTLNGELVSKHNTSTGETTTYDYDVLGNLRSLTLPDGTAISYVIDGKNRRIGKKVNGALVSGLLYKDGLKPLAELDAAGNVVSRFVYADSALTPAYMVKGSVTYRIISDHLGSVRLVVYSATGAIVQRLDYDEYGKVTQDTNPGFQPFGFAGGLYDHQTGLVRFGARDYDAEVGRWTIKDLVEFSGNQVNLYVYVHNDPVNFLDKWGLLGEKQVREQLDTYLGDRLTAEEKDKAAKFIGQQIGLRHLKGLLSSDPKALQALDERVRRALEKGDKETKNLFERIDEIKKEIEKEFEKKSEEICPKK